MKLHIVGGFLGSGKTTAIINAAKVWSTQGKKVGVITNDHNKYLISSPFVNANYSLADEVINGCFSSDLDNLSDKIVRLHTNTQIDTIFAECVGSCTDIVSTTVKPLMIFNQNSFESITLSTFIDARLLLVYLRGDKFPFNDNINYIFGKQIEESDLLIVNKIDRVPREDLLELKWFVDRKMSDKNIICQNSQDPNNIIYWLKTLDRLPMQNRASLEIDYRLYGQGEVDLIWVNKEIDFSSIIADAYELAIRFVENVVTEIRLQQIPIGHLQFLLVNGAHIQKISFTAVYDEDWKAALSAVSTNQVTLILNARIETTQDVIRAIIKNALTAVSNNETNVRKRNSSAFQSGLSISASRIPKATHGCEDCICLRNLLARNAIRLKDGSDAALAELESEQFECCGACSDVEGCCC